MKHSAPGWSGMLALVFVLLGAQQVLADDRLVFGSFQNAANAENWAARMTVLLNVDVTVVPVTNSAGAITYRVVTAPLAEADAGRIRQIAEGRQLKYWRLLDVEAAATEPPVRAAPEERQTRALPVPVRPDNPQRRANDQPPVRPAEVIRATAVQDNDVVQMLDVDVGAQARTFFEEGIDGQAKFQPSLSIKADYYQAWDEERQSFTFSPFYRYDAEDEERTHFDIREGFWSLVGNDWDLHLGVKQVFWGVTEFNHLVDIINQTDLVENLDGEDKLGQPMAHLSLVRDWGILDFHLLAGFRERTFPGPDGRPRFFVPIDNDHATYESGAEDGRIDGAIRWSHNLGALEIGLYQFNGTSRAPLFEPVLDSDGELLLRPHYPVINQTGLDAQAIYGDWAFKLESIYRTNFPDSYYAFNAGFERTLVGAFGTRADLGLVMEYQYDDRGGGAFDTFFENDIALATRWALNDFSDTQALIGLIWDHDSHETIFTLEASRRLGETWMLLLEGRAFAGAASLNREDPLDPGNKGASVARDDYIELELTKYF